jgi:hypothetical protein
VANSSDEVEEEDLEITPHEAEPLLVALRTGGVSSMWHGHCPSVQLCRICLIALYTLETYPASLSVD